MTLETSILRRVILGSSAALALVLIPLRPNPEPLYLQFPLSFWGHQLDLPLSEQHPETRSALHALCLAASPELSRRLAATENPLHGLLTRAARRIPGWGSPFPSAEVQRRSAVRIAEELGDAAAPLLPGLLQGFRRTQDSATRDRLGRILLRLGPVALPGISALALDPDPRVRSAAIRTLAAVADASPFEDLPGTEIAIRLAAQLATEPSVILAATEALPALGTHAAVAVPAVIANLEHPLAAIRSLSAKTLGRIAHQNPGCIAPLALCLRDPVVDVRSAAATALGRFGPRAARTCPALIEALALGSTPVSLAAIQALGKIGPLAEAAMPELIAQLQRPETPPILRSAAANAIARIARLPGLAVPALARRVRDPDEYVRRSAVRALGAYGSLAAPAVPALIDALSDPLESVRVHATEALGAIGPAARHAVPFLQAARNNNQSVMNPPVLAAVARIESRTPTAPGPGDGEVSPSPGVPDTSGP